MAYLVIEEFTQTRGNCCFRVPEGSIVTDTSYWLDGIKEEIPRRCLKPLYQVELTKALPPDGWSPHGIPAGTKAYAIKADGPHLSVAYDSSLRQTIEHYRFLPIQIGHAAPGMVVQKGSDLLLVPANLSKYIAVIDKEMIVVVNLKTGSLATLHHETEVTPVQATTYFEGTDCVVHHGKWCNDAFDPTLWSDCAGRIKEYHNASAALASDNTNTRKARANYTGVKR